MSRRDLQVCSYGFISVLPEIPIFQFSTFNHFYKKYLMLPPGLRKICFILHYLFFPSTKKNMFSSNLALTAPNIDYFQSEFIRCPQSRTHFFGSRQSLCKSSATGTVDSTGPKFLRRRPFSGVIDCRSTQLVVVFAHLRTGFSCRALRLETWTLEASADHILLQSGMITSIPPFAMNSSLW